MHGFFVIEKTDKRKIFRLLGVRIASKKLKIITAPSTRERKLSEKSELSNRYDVLKDSLPITIENISKIIELETVKVISFGIFDNLLIRPTFEPKDVLHLLFHRVKKKYNIDLCNARLLAIDEFIHQNVSLSDIYNFVAKKLSLDEKTKLLLQQEELDIESKLLTVRKDFMYLYDMAVKNNKKIIAISDTYLPEDFLLSVLRKNGFCKIEKIYTPISYNKKKDNGELFGDVISNENIEPSAILHIGGNYNSDYLQPIGKNITAIYYPYIKDILISEQSIYREILSEYANFDLGQRLLIGFSFNRVFADYYQMPKKPNVFSDVSYLSRLLLSPLILYMALKILQNNEIQDNYEKIYFASNNECLIEFAYNFLKDNLLNKKLPIQHLLMSKQIYHMLKYEDFIRFIESLDDCDNEYYKFRNMLEDVILDKSLLEKLLNLLSEEERELLFFDNKEKCIDILKRFNLILNQYLIKLKNNLVDYLSQEVKDNLGKRGIVFNLENDELLSGVLTNITHILFDQIYSFNGNSYFQKNNDKIRSFCISPTISDSTSLKILMCSLFSPSKLLLENEKFQNDLLVIKNEIKDYLSQFINVFGSYVSFWDITDLSAFARLFDFSWQKSPYCEMNQLRHVFYQGSSPFYKTKSIQYQLIMENYQFDNVFFATGFANPEKRYIPKSELSLSFNKKIGIHCHLYNIDLSEEILKYLHDFPVKFDLILTIPDEKKRDLLINLFNKKIVKNLNILSIILVPNRGRDVAPWLIETKKYQDQYDLFCHIHSKKSPHLSYSSSWRNYLFSNLIKKESVIDIFNIFEQNQSVGIIINDFYSALKHGHIQNNISLAGNYNEQKLIDRLIYKMGFSTEMCLNDQLFAAGTMFWYRPKALEQLFVLNLSYEDFPKEPIGVGGTIAHAIERLPVFVCEQNGYKGCVYTKYPS
ncbi:hypothetical protein GQ597_07910 [Gilliamella sp. Pra-s65]|uniref:rhamnan synthesis F family protein n=1 Tax=unclassified Gilliamella TaxID=2685620 RepID=UPI001365A6BF|nr:MULTISPECIES: rhamnan synthesis F family protein [unclassified Gilliamella]MWN90622.1 hypothetical protein [Gilliamella sp. Pra-s65]MWP73734.1 hypothetical protein [Gilliamella sp. Pra-s52]